MKKYKREWLTWSSVGEETTFLRGDGNGEGLTIGERGCSIDRRIVEYDAMNEGSLPVELAVDCENLASDVDWLAFSRRQLEVVPSSAIEGERGDGLDILAEESRVEGRRNVEGTVFFIESGACSGNLDGRDGKDCFGVGLVNREGLALMMQNESEGVATWRIVE